MSIVSDISGKVSKVSVIPSTAADVSMENIEAKCLNVDLDCRHTNLITAAKSTTLTSVESEMSIAGNS
jgi:hypothetical protein